MGAAAAIATRLFSARRGLRSRDKLIALCFAVMSPMVAAVGAAVVVSKGGVLFDRSLLLASLAVVLLAFFTVRFPAAIGFPCVVGLGAAVALFGYCFFSLPPAIEGSAIGFLVFGEGSAASVRFGPVGSFAPTGDAGNRSRNFYSPSLSVRAEALLVRFDGLWPVFGGTERVVLSSVRFGAGLPIERPEALPFESLFKIDRPAPLISGISLRLTSAEFTTEQITAGTRLGIYLDDGAIHFRP